MRTRLDDTAVLRHGPRAAVTALALVAASALALSGCGGGGGNHGASNKPAGTAGAAGVGGATAGSTTTVTASQQIVATPSGGSGGVGPITPANPHGNIALPDRTLTVNSAVRAPGTSASAVTVRVNVAIQNPGASPILNAGSFFEVMAPEGDILGPIPGSGTSLDGGIAAHGTRTGTIAFEVPASAVSNLRLLYRPGPNAQTVLVPLTVS